ncbi:MAG TPA: hypothetical protein VK463_05235 [Desulfomonilaceae bacterium]|nr:hypothetical protein [Desulfomonilaceae bacterium]
MSVYVVSVHVMSGLKLFGHDRIQDRTNGEVRHGVRAGAIHLRSYGRQLPLRPGVREMKHVIRIRFFTGNSILGAGWGLSFAADDAEPSHHFAEDSPQPCNLINLIANAYYSDRTRYGRCSVTVSDRMRTVPKSACSAL